jgi:hypothetical protein
MDQSQQEVDVKTEKTQHHTSSRAHLLQIILIVLQLEIDVCVKASELDCSTIIGPTQSNSTISAHQQAKLTSTDSPI